MSADRLREAARVLREDSEAASLDPGQVMWGKYKAIWRAHLASLFAQLLTEARSEGYRNGRDELDPEEYADE